MHFCITESKPLRRLLAAVICAALAATIPSATANEATAPPAITLGAPFGDHAILQQGTEVPVWGWSKPGTEVTIEFAGQKSSAKAGEDGKWMAKLAALSASAEGRPMTITEKGGKSMTLNDILVGEVWMASGQSNMQWVASKSSATILLKELKEQAAEGGAMPVIREFKVTNRFAHLHPIEHAEGSWSEDHANFSAVAFAFAHKIHQEIGVPIGILNCSFSETSIQAWTPRHGVMNSDLPYNKSLAAKLLQTDPATPEHQSAWDAFYQNFMDAVAHNQNVAKAGEGQLVDLPTKTPGNMNGNRDATWLYNARIHPVVPYALRGCIWNQGYANMGGGIAYYDNLHALIPGWRAAWGMPDLPVYFHQFYSPGDLSKSPNHPTVGGAAEMRLGTWMARDIPHTGMASQIDIQGSIHYNHKTVPGQRLALHALKNQYGKNIVTDGPMIRSYEVKGKDLIVSFDHAEGGLVVADPTYHAIGRHPDSTGFANPKIVENGDGQVRLFHLAGEDRVWHPAAVRIDGGKAIVSSPAVPNPRGVSYGTGGVGFQPNLYNKALLPTTPFMLYDNEVVLESTWPDSPIKIVGVETDPSTVGLLNDYRKMPILASQFDDNAVLQAGKPITFWGSAVHDWGHDAEGEAVIHFNFDGTEKTIPVVNGMKEWSVTLPAVEASDKPRTLTVRLTIDGELAHERIAENIVFGDVWYVAGFGNQPIGNIDAPVTGPIRIMTRMAKGFLAKGPRTYTVATSSTPKNRFASYWSEPTGEGLAAALAKAIHAKTGKPVGIIFMDAQNLELKHWMDVPSLANAPSLKADYENLAAITPGTPFYQKNADRYVADWKNFWSDYIPQMIATKAVPDDKPWGSFPNFGNAVTTDATQAFNVLVASFRNTQVKGIVFFTEPSMFASDEGANFASEMSALANGFKRHFNNTSDPHFLYTIPAKSLAPKVANPTAIDGSATAIEITAWPESARRGEFTPEAVTTATQGIIEAILKK
jgi:sialate O-acetylesterase